MKIIYIHQYFTLPETSGNTRSYDLAMSFVKQGHRVEFLTTSCNIKGDFHDGWNILPLNENITLNVLKTRKYDNSLSTFQRIKFFFHFLWFSSVKILNIPAELVIATSTPLTVGIPALIKSWFGKTPFIFEVRDVWPEAVIAIGAIKNSMVIKSLELLEGIIYKNSKHIVALSTDMKKSIVHRYPELEKNITVIENLSVINRFTVSESKINGVPVQFKKNNKFKIVYAGAFGKVNALEYVVELAFLLLPLEPNITFILIGNGAEKNNVIERAKRLGVFDKNLFILDPVSKNDLPPIYSHTEMGSSFVAPIKELWSNSANKFFDTLAAGKPILINYEGWQSEVIKNANVGYVLPYDLKNITKEDLLSFIHYTRNTPLQIEQRLNAKKLSRRYSLETASEKYLNIIELFPT
ncbi:glycosyltransferase family 4 protein [Robertkochia flava]|uniref:glycosyltransferase family 4 protein n=1 Tax=Robertkochia flava TaxID=3447986 RepID=UPI001CC9FC4A|nr:glycosyltransferase family 4 protein [Robertkochia marina]